MAVVREAPAALASVKLDHVDRILTTAASPGLQMRSYARRCRQRRRPSSGTMSIAYLPAATKEAHMVANREYLTHLGEENRRQHVALRSINRGIARAMDSGTTTRSA